MAILSQYMRDKDSLDKAKCCTCDGYGMHPVCNDMIMGALQCDACGGMGYNIKVMTTDALEQQMRLVARGEILAPPDAAVPSREFRGTLRDYSTSELMAEYMRRDGCG